MRLLIICVAISLLSCESIKKSAIAKEGVTNVSIGLEKGYLVLAGGAMGWEWDTVIWDKPSIESFIQLIGGKEKKVIVIPTAGVMDDEIKDESFYSKIRKSLAGEGLKSVEIMHAKDTVIANSPEFLQKIRDADAIWFTGGSAKRLADTYLHTKILEEINNLLQRGGVVGGNSAGAVIMCPYIPWRNESNQRKFDQNYKGFNIFKNAFIMPHFLRSNDQFAYFDWEIKTKFPQLIGIGIDEWTAVVVHKNEMDVVGKGYIAIYDGTFKNEDSPPIVLPKNSERFYLLWERVKYDLATRSVIR